MRVHEVALAVIGTGPAGLSAAAEAAKFGINTIVLDMHDQAGGHFFNLPPDELQPTRPGKEFGEGKSLINRAKLAGAEILPGAEVWGIYSENPFRICLSGNQLKEIRAQKIILAPGAIEHFLPFPGWTLPGVITAGGALSLLKKQKMIPGRRILIGGTGPLPLNLAAHLANYDVGVICELELKSRASIFRHWRSILSASMRYQRIWEGLIYLRKLQSKKIPYLFGWSVIQAIGEGEVRGAIIAQVDATGKPIPGSEKAIDLDCICLGFGLLPDTRLTRLVDCSHILHPRLHTWVPVRDEFLQTSLPGVFAIGDAADIIGKAGAALEGRIAALAVARQMGLLEDEAAHQIAAPLNRKLNAERRFAQMLHETFELPKNPSILAKPETVICRCECITLQQIQEAIRDGATSVQAVKYHSRAGMGWCRGITCAPLISQIIAQQGGVNLELASRSSTRPPIFPVSLEDALEHEGLT
jgi:thioredoxin reductase/bacterioferritin-associated ferredoxin